jgi:hypothetical protein
LAENGLGYILGDFSQTLSGHPAQALNFWILFPLLIISRWNLTIKILTSSSNYKTDWKTDEESWYIFFKRMRCF